MLNNIVTLKYILAEVINFIVTNATVGSINFE